MMHGGWQYSLGIWSPATLRVSLAGFDPQLLRLFAKAIRLVKPRLFLKFRSGLIQQSRRLPQGMLKSDFRLLPRLGQHLWYLRWMGWNPHVRSAPRRHARAAP